MATMMNATRLQSAATASPGPDSGVRALDSSLTQARGNTAAVAILELKKLRGWEIQRVCQANDVQKRDVPLPTLNAA